jgi:hypothetical protein
MASKSFNTSEETPSMSQNPTYFDGAEVLFMGALAVAVWGA